MRRGTKWILEIPEVPSVWPACHGKKIKIKPGKTKVEMQMIITPPGIVKECRLERVYIEIVGEITV